MKLFKVSIETEVYVAAETQSAAEELASEKLDEIVRNEDRGNFDCYAQQAINLKAIPLEWHDCLPYGSDRKTCKEIMSE